MRLHAGLLKMFWEDSINTTTYLINRGPSVPLGFRIPEEEWEGKEVSLTHLNVFGCDSYVKMKDVARDKLDAKAIKCTFISYDLDEIGYRFWDTKDHKVARSREVTFNEDSLYGAKATTYFMRASRIVEVQMKKTLKMEHPPRREALRLHRYEGPTESPRLRNLHGITTGFLVSWERRKPHVQVKEKSVRIEASIKTMAPTWQRNMAEINKLKRQLSQEFEMKDLGSAKQILGMSIIKDNLKGSCLTRKRALRSCQVVVTLLERYVHQGGDNRELKLCAASTSLQDN
ncbi:retrovirus-related pol polyprotein from transposon TNT 1-94 [Tanacetum coccineum]